MATCATATAWACVDPQRPRRAQPRLAHRRVAQRALRRVAQPRRRRALRLRLPRAQPRRRPRRLPRPRRQRAQPRLRLRRLCAYHLATPPATPTVSAAAVSAIRDSAVSSAPALRADRCSTAARPTVSAAAEFAAYSAVICADRRGTCAPLTMTAVAGTSASTTAANSHSFPNSFTCTRSGQCCSSTCSSGPSTKRHGGGKRTDSGCSER
jgi:hypothetical protein